MHLCRPRQTASRVKTCTSYHLQPPTQHPPFVETTAYASFLCSRLLTPLFSTHHDPPFSRHASLVDERQRCIKGAFDGYSGVSSRVLIANSRRNLIGAFDTSVVTAPSATGRWSHPPPLTTIGTVRRGSRTILHALRRSWKMRQRSFRHAVRLSVPRNENWRRTRCVCILQGSYMRL